MYCSYRCKRGYEAAKAQFEAATTDSEKDRWYKTMNVWRSRYNKAKEFN